MPNEQQLTDHNETAQDDISPKARIDLVRSQVREFKTKYQSGPAVANENPAEKPIREPSPYWLIDETRRLKNAGAIEDPASHTEDIKYLGNQYPKLQEKLMRSSEIDVRSFSEQKFHLQQELNAIRQELYGHATAPPHKRFMYVIRDSRLNKKQSELEDQIGALDFEIQQRYRRGDNARIEAQQIQEKLGVKNRESSDNILKKELEQVRDGYVAVVRDLMKDGSLMSELRAQYINTSVRPRIIERISEGSKSQIVADKLLIDFQELLDKRDRDGFQNDLETDSWEKEVNGLIMNISALDFTFGQLLRPLANNQDTALVENFFYMDAVDQMYSLSDVAKTSDPELSSRSDRIQGQIFEDRNAWKENQGFIDGGLKYLNLDQFVKIDNYRNFNQLDTELKILQIIKKNPQLRAVIGDRIDEFDQAVSKRIQQHSLTDRDGGYIHALEIYPEPDSIRNLVLLASADYQNYRTVNANGALSTLAERPDWENLLDSAIEKYPELESMRQVLKSWNYGEQTSNPEIGDSASAFAIQVAQTAGGDGYLRELALQACPNSKILEVLVANKKITQQQREAIETAQALIQQDNDQLDGYEITNDFYTATYRGRHIISGATSYFPNKLKELQQLATISQAIVENSEDKNYRNFLTSEHIISILQKDISEEQLGILLQIPQIVPEIQKTDMMHFVREYPQVFLTEQTLRTGVYIAEQVSDQGHIHDIMGKVGAQVISPEVAKMIVDNGKVFFGEKMDGVRGLVLQDGNTLISSPDDVKFLVRMVGRFGARAADVIKSYRDCLSAKVISTEDKALVMEFVEQFRMPSPEMMMRFKTAKETGTEQLFLSELKSLANRVTSGAIITEEERSKPFFKDLIQCVFPNNVGSWTTYESNASCSDRNSDLSQYIIRPNYEIDLMAVGNISLKEGVSLDRPNIERLVNNVLSVAKRFEEMGYDPEKMQGEVVSQIDKELKRLSEAGGLKGVSLDSLSTVDEKLFLLMAEAEYGNSKVLKSDLKKLMISYEFAYFEDVRDYIQGTTDRVSKAGNADYALLCELDNFYSDRVKEVGRRIVEAGWDNQVLSEKMPEYFANLVEISQQKKRQETLNRFQIDKLGLSEGFISQMVRQLKERTGRDYSPKKVREILERYESKAGGLIDSRSLNRDRMIKQKEPGKKRTREEITQAIYGQFKSQRDKTMNAAAFISGENLDPQSVHIGEINLQQLLETQMSIVEGVYDDEQFASYTGQRFVDLFVDERQIIEKELSKFVSDSGNERTVLNAYITKSKESANARMVGGVCVSGDNPNKNPNKNMWDMDNYFQLVLQDPESFQCQGLALLHNFTEDGKKIITASLNPSSTYLYSVDESAMFTGMMSALERFAQDNNFDEIVLSQNKGIRTNRTGGTFEKTMNERVAQIGTKRQFAQEETFSFVPPYKLKDMDVVWNKPVATAV